MCSSPTRGTRRLVAGAQRLGTPLATVQMGDRVIEVPGADHAAALAQILPAIEGPIDAVGHRVVHGGERFAHPVRIDDAVEAAIAELIPLAPLHNPANLAGIRAARAALPDVMHVAVFDTAFHQTLPRRARTYALPLDLQKKHGIRRYGFHGPSHQWVARQAATHLDAELRDLRIITCHLGNGASVTAVEYGRSVETSMGMTPLEGLVMGTRAGDVDAGGDHRVDAPRRARRRRHRRAAEQTERACGALGQWAMTCAISRPVRPRATRHVAWRSTCSAIGCASISGPMRRSWAGWSAIVFTAGIGENSALIRHRVAQRLDFLGARLDEDLNRDARVSADKPIADLSPSHSRTKLLVVHTDEARAIATDTLDLLRNRDAVSDPGTVPIAVSARHLHLTQEHVEALFGPGHTLHLDQAADPSQGNSPPPSA